MNLANNRSTKLGTLICSTLARTVRHTGAVGVLGPTASRVTGLPSRDGGGPRAAPDCPAEQAGRSARAQGAAKVAGGAWISLLGGTPSGRRDPM